MQIKAEHTEKKKQFKIGHYFYICQKITLVIHEESLPTARALALLMGNYYYYFFLSIFLICVPPTTVVLGRS